MFDGLYAGSNSLTQDFGLNLYRIQVGLLECTVDLNLKHSMGTLSKCPFGHALTWSSF